MLVLAGGIEIAAPYSPQFSDILSEDAITFVTKLAREFSSRRDELLLLRAERQSKIDQNLWNPDFPKETEEIRRTEWKIAPIPGDLQDRRVEITGPAGDTKMVINALNSGASTYMADFEDSQSPTWETTMQGQINLRDAIDRKITYTSPEGKRYKLNDRTATLIVRPRGWHLLERHVFVDGKPIPASLFDFGLFLYHNAKKLIARGSGPYFYMPKLENRFEARLWNDVFLFSEAELGIPRGSIKATVLIETILAAFEMDEILYELREHIVGLNCGRWDYIFSFIKKFRNDPNFVLPDRAQVTMDKAFLAAYVALLINTCHKRGAHAIGGMSAYIPVKNDEEANRVAFEKVRKDKEREVRSGHDGTWVAHPGLVSLAKEVFDASMPRPNQIAYLQEDIDITAEDLLSVPSGEITENGVRTNVSVGIQYLAAWLGGKGSVPLYNLMEDTATAEICRAQLWQWIRHESRLSDGRKITLNLIRHIVKQELERIRSAVGPDLFESGHYYLAAELFDLMLSSHEFREFLTIPAYTHLLFLERQQRDGEHGK